MGSLCMPQLTVLLPHGKLALPAALSVALITGFTFSMITLSPALHGAAVLPVMESFFLVSLPHLWQASLSWVTPPCLFLLLNGIIVILTATSGTLSCKPCPPSSSELPPLLLPRAEKDARHDHGIESTALTVTSDSRIAAHTAAAIVVPDSGTDPSASSPLDLVSFLGDPLSTDPCAPALTLTVPDMAVAELPEYSVICDGGSAPNSDGGSSAPNSDGDHEDEKELLLISPEAFQEVADCSNAPIFAHEDGYGDHSTDQELGDESAKGSSAPSTPKQPSSSPASWKDSTRRSLSIDSAPWSYDLEGSPEYSLSEEAFKKRIDDYICKVNAKLRSETRHAPLL